VRRDWDYHSYLCSLSASLRSRERLGGTRGATTAALFLSSCVQDCRVAVEPRQAVGTKQRRVSSRVNGNRGQGKRASYGCMASRVHQIERQDDIHDLLTELRNILSKAASTSICGPIRTNVHERVQEVFRCTAISSLAAVTICRFITVFATWARINPLTILSLDFSSPT
jgi:hypothetical protein